MDGCFFQLFHIYFKLVFIHFLANGWYSSVVGKEVGQRGWYSVNVLTPENKPKSISSRTDWVMWRFYHFKCFQFACGGHLMHEESCLIKKYKIYSQRPCNVYIISLFFLASIYRFKQKKRKKMKMKKHFATGSHLFFSEVWTQITFNSLILWL